VARKFFLALALLSALRVAYAQSCQVYGRVVDDGGRVVPGAEVTGGGADTRANSDGDFSLLFACKGRSSIEVTASALGALSSPVEALAGSSNVVLVVRPETIEQSASVTATRSATEVGPTADTTSTLSAVELTQYPALTLDERLRQHAGFELFRRSSSWVANPTSEGISLRGLGSTAASRTLVLTSGVPLNDPFGGWVHWNEMPPETISAVTLVSGGGSDLYGSSALGGVIDVLSARPGPPRAEVDLAAASEDTTDFSGRGDTAQSKWNGLLAGQVFRTDGYTIVAPAVRGAVDVPSNVHFENGHVEVDRSPGVSGRVFLIGNILNEAHGNGTPVQTNGTRLWRYIAGDDWTAGLRISGRIRGFGSDEAYRQSFSAINAARSAESLSRLQRVGTQEVGASADSSFHLMHIAFIGGGDLRDIRATDLESPYSKNAPSGVQDTSARQRFFGGFGEVVAEDGGWSGAASLRADEAANISTRAMSQTGTLPATVTATPDRREAVLSPRLGLVRQLPYGMSIRASGFRAFRTPTMNELYRTGQVGQQTTLANSSLLAERATGAEGGGDWTSQGKGVAAQATYFWTAINRPVSAVLVSSTATSITNRRENLGQIVSQGVELSAQARTSRAVLVDFGYVYAHATVTAFNPQPAFVGLWIPEVPRHSATAQLHYRPTSAMSFTVAAREIGHAFDDSSNVYRLHGFFVLDAYAEVRVARINPRLTFYASFQNVLDRNIETARTPYLTLGTPFTAQGGVRLMLGAH
jgi:outer membrane receptor protein involved in Fe transport